MGVKVKERNGKWWLFVNWKGRKKAKCVGSKEAAEKAKIMLEARLALGAEVIFEPMKKPESPPPLFGDYYRAWLDRYVRHAYKQSTWKIYDLDFRVYLDPVFGRTPLAEITRDHPETHPPFTHRRGCNRR